MEGRNSAPQPQKPHFEGSGARVARGSALGQQMHLSCFAESSVRQGSLDPSSVFQNISNVSVFNLTSLVITFLKYEMSNLRLNLKKKKT